MGAARDRRFEIRDVGLDRRVALVGDGPGADIGVTPAATAATAERRGEPLGPRVVVGKSEVLPPRRARSHLFARSGQLPLEAIESFDDVGEEPRFALLAVGDDIDPRFDLLSHRVRDRLPHLPRKRFAVVRLPLFLESKKRQQGVRSGQAPHVGRENSLRTVFHGFLFSWLAEAETAYRSRQGFARWTLTAWPRKCQLAIENLLAKHWSLLIRFGDVCATQ